MVKITALGATLAFRIEQFANHHALEFSGDDVELLMVKRKAYEILLEKVDNELQAAEEQSRDIYASKEDYTQTWTITTEQKEGTLLIPEGRCGRLPKTCLSLNTYLVPLPN